MRAHLLSLGYPVVCPVPRFWKPRDAGSGTGNRRASGDMRDGDYALPANLQPLNARFECAKWVKVSDQELQVLPASGSL